MQTSVQFMQTFGANDKKGGGLVITPPATSRHMNPSLWLLPSRPDQVNDLSLREDRQSYHSRPIILFLCRTGAQYTSLFLYCKTISQFSKILYRVLSCLLQYSFFYPAMHGVVMVSCMPIKIKRKRLCY